jgi:hypothetical protein
MVTLKAPRLNGLRIITTTLTSDLTNPNNYSSSNAMHTIVKNLNS